VGISLKTCLFQLDRNEPQYSPSISRASTLLFSISLAEYPLTLDSRRSNTINPNDRFRWKAYVQM
jgi:hypothetical protein